MVGRSRNVRSRRVTWPPRSFITWACRSTGRMSTSRPAATHRRRPLPDRGTDLSEGSGRKISESHEKAQKQIQKLTTGARRHGDVRLKSRTGIHPQMDADFTDGKKWIRLACCGVWRVWPLVRHFSICEICVIGG